MLSRERLAAVVLTIFVWGLAGAVFGALFVALFHLLALVGVTGWKALMVGATVSAVTTVAFYSTMIVAMVGATAGVLASIGYLILSGQSLDLTGIASAAAAFGFLAGGFFAWVASGNARPLAETLTGLLAGLAAGALLVLAQTIYPHPVSTFAMAAGVVALVGSLFQLNEHWMVQTFTRWLPAGLAAPIVASLIAAVVGASIWLMSGTSAAAVDLATRQTIDQVFAAVPEGFLGGMLGGAVAGLVLELLGFRLEQHEPL